MRIPSKIILEGLLLVALLFVSYYLYNFSINMKHDLPVIKGAIKDDTLVQAKSFFSLDINKMNEVATFTESMTNLKTSIEYPKNKPEILNEFKSIYEAWKLDIGNNLYSTSSAGGSNQEYIIKYEGVHSINSAIHSLIFDTYTYNGGAHGASNMLVYNYNKDGQKLNSLVDLYDTLTPNRNGSLSPNGVYKIIHDAIRPQLISQLKSKYGEKELSKSDLNWLDEGISYSATNTNNYKTWWIYTDHDPMINIHIGQYQIAPYAYGQFDVVVPVSDLVK